MKSILDDFPEKTNNDFIFLLPIDRLTIEYKVRIRNVVVYPAGTVDIDELFKSHSFIEDISKNTDLLKRSTLISFLSKSPTKFPAQIIYNLELLRYATDYITPVIDFIIFSYCNINNSSNLPGHIGQILTGESLLLIFHEFGSPFTRIICEKVHTNTITLGNGLIIKEPDSLSLFNLLNNDIDEVGQVAKHALRMYTQLLESNSETEKFIHAIRLFEFIASPEKYEKFQNVKSNIIAHVASNIKQIHEISEEFKYYSSGNAADGLRTQIFHNGKKLEELIIRSDERKELFVKLHGYLFTCISDLLGIYNKKWQNVEELRVRKRENAEGNKTNIKRDNYSSTLVLVDCDYLSKSIIRFQKIYCEVYPQKKLDKIDLNKLCYETLLNTRTWEEGKIFGFFLFHTKIRRIPFVEESIDEMNGKSLKINTTEIEFHSLKFESSAKLFQGINKIIDELNQNLKIITDKRSVFEKIIFCGDNKKYESSLKRINAFGSKEIILIRNSHDSKMHLEISYFDIGHLVGKILGLKHTEL